MKSLSKVVWSEGMYLAPHHFQRQGRFFESILQFASRAAWYANYGVSGFQPDTDALRNGSASIIHARGLFPDGLPFSIPESDIIPTPLAVADRLQPTHDSAIVCLAIPPYRTSAGNCTLDHVNAATTRFTGEQRVVPDETSGADERAIVIGRKNLFLALESELPPDAVFLRLARILRSGAGSFLYDPEYIPSCIQIGASDSLLLRLRRLIDILEEKSASLSRSGRDSRTGASLASGEIASFWLLHAVNSALPLLRHMWTSRALHPDRLFFEMSRLGGALCTFSLTSDARSLPLYDHDDLTTCFSALDTFIRDHLEIVIPTNCISIPLHAAGDYLWTAEISDSRVIGPSEWILAIRSPVGDAELITRVPQLVKVCSAKFVVELVKRALPGLPLTHLSVPPPAISARVETKYFSISKTGPCWDHLVQTRQIGVYVPGDFPKPEMELLVILNR